MPSGVFITFVTITTRCAAKSSPTITSPTTFYDGPCNGYGTSSDQNAVLPLRHKSTFCTRFGFSIAAATRSLSLSCLLTDISEVCDPG